MPAASADALTLVVALILVASLHVIVGELIPKQITFVIPERMALALVPILYGLAWMLRPIVWALNALSIIVHPNEMLAIIGPNGAGKTTLLDLICGKTKAQIGKKRIGLVIDFGKRTYAPKGEAIQKRIVRCVVTDTKSQGLDVLAESVKVRQDDSGLICGLSGYPAKECGVEIVTPKSLLRK